MGQVYAKAGVEPPLEELLDDQIARLIMRGDGIEPADVWRSIAAARARPAHRTSDPPVIGGDVAALAEIALSRD
jgi:hypothetical protein